MTLRVAVGGISHETNTYAVACFGPTTLADFQCDRGEALLDRHRGTRTYIGGMIDGAAEIGAELVPTFYAIAEPSGTIAADAYASMKEELVTSLAGVLPVDAVCLELHGAGVVEGIEDLEADLGAAVREVIGQDVPLVCPLDLHGNITPAMADVFDLMLGVHYYPHTDMYERGAEAITSLPKLVSGEWRPTTHVEWLPMLLPTSTTDLHPAKSVNEWCWDVEGRTDLIDCTFFHGFPFTDVSFVGSTVVVTTNDDIELARSSAKEVAARIWEHRDDFTPETYTPELAIRVALEAVSADGPVVINDTADNSGGGAPGDSTHLLRAMLDADLADAAFGFIYDPEVAAAAHAAGTGATIDVKLGGKHDDVHGEPIAATAYVKCLSDGRFLAQTPMLQGFQMDLGPMARLVIGRMDVIVGSRRSQTFDAELFLLHGIDVTRYAIVALKSSNHFRAGFASLATQIVTADSPGLTTQRVEVFPHPASTSPLWPQDPSASYA